MNTKYVFQHKKENGTVANSLIICSKENCLFVVEDNPWEFG